MAIIAHVTMFVLPVLVAIALRVTVGRSDDRFTKHHTNEAMNAQLWFVIVWNLAAVPLIFFGEAEEPPGWAFAVSFPLFAAIWVGALVLCIRAALRASRGEYYRYPVPFRFTKGSVREATA
ncbi:MAG TPA: DUF4870 domain-containing protein [Angustibacter sp.]|nr:DUF4870 domain-containing protein [Angustibacter sp.]